MPRDAYWTCRACNRQLGQVRTDGSLEVLAGRVIVPATAEAIVIIICPACGDRRRWPLPGFETKVGAVSRQ